MFSLLGNTLANFNDDVGTLRTLAELMKPGDVMLLELAVTSRDKSRGCSSCKQGSH